MREIKFRAWDGEDMFTHENQGDDYWFEYNFTGLSLVINEQYFETGSGVAEETWRTRDISAKFMQYTGLKDKNGTEIYEGDIVYAYKNKATYEVKHGEYDNICVDDQPSPNSYGWYITKDRIPSINHIFDGEGLSEADKYLEVIGNMYENPELLEVKP